MKIVWLLLAFIVCAVRPVAAEDKIKEAAGHYRQGKAFEKQGQWDQAITEYKAAHALDNKASHLFNIARAYDQKGDPKSAIEFYEKFLAIESDGPNAKQARELVAIATKKVTEEEQRKRDEEAQRKRDEEVRRKAEQEAAAKLAAENHVKQARAYESANAWAEAAASHKAATAADGDPVHLIAAAEAFRKVPDLAKAKATYEEYLAKVPTGGRSDEARTAIANLAAEIDKAERDLKVQKLSHSLKDPVTPIDTPKKKSRLSPKWLAIGGALLVAGLVTDLVPASGKNGTLDGTDFIAPGLYGLGAAAVIRGVF